MTNYSLAIDQGTTSCRAIIFDDKGNSIAKSQYDFKQIYPQPGWVEHCPQEIIDTQLKCIAEVMIESKLSPHLIKSIGITNQRETVIVWNKNTGKPIYNAIVWQCRRTSTIIDNLADKHEFIRNKTGLIPDAYFSATKIAWILDNVPGARNSANNGELLFGTIDSWLIYNFTKEKNHYTEYSNASRTMLFNINSLEWDKDLFDLFNIPINMAPKVMDSNEFFGEFNSEQISLNAPINSCLGDQQASLFGQGCIDIGQAKCTYGTGSFILINTRDNIVFKEGLLTSIAWKLKNEKTTYCIEGANFTSGAIIKWLIEELKIITKPEQTQDIAFSLDDNGGVYLIPAFVGLGSPWWRQDIRAIICGLTRGSNNNYIVRAALEAMAYQVHDIINGIKNEVAIKNLSVDGGACKNDFLLQFLSDLAQISVSRCNNVEATAWGVCALSMITLGFIDNLEIYLKTLKFDSIFKPKISRDKEYKTWTFLLNNFLKINWHELY